MQHGLKTHLYAQEAQPVGNSLRIQHRITPGDDEKFYNTKQIAQNVCLSSSSMMTSSLITDNWKWVVFWFYRKQGSLQTNEYKWT